MNRTGLKTSTLGLGIIPASVSKVFSLHPYDPMTERDFTFGLKGLATMLA
jgi:hypothetical protein